MQDELTTCSLARLASLIRRKEISPVDVVNGFLQRIGQLNGGINAIVTLTPDLLELARASEARLVRGDVAGPLHGIPLTIKDTIATAGTRTTSGSRLRTSHVPAVDAEAVARLKAAGAIILGKTNTPEMAIPYETDNPVFGRTNNPYDPRFTPGGSSGGEAAAIAACLSPGGLGSDLSGSIRVPAHFCGIVGLRPTSGRISMHGHFPEAHGPLAFGACIGPMARRVEDVTVLFQVLAEPDAESAPALDEIDIVGWRVSWYDDDGVSPVSVETKLAVRAAVKALTDAGLDAVDERPPAIESGPRLWIDLFSQISAVKLREFYAGAEHLAGPAVLKVLNATKQSSSQSSGELRQALDERDRLRGKLLEWMDTTPLLVTPVAATAAFPHGTQRLNVAGESIGIFRAFSNVQTFNVFDLPAVVLRAGQTADGLPIGIQIVGRPFGEASILAAAAIVESALGGWEPPIVNCKS